MAFAERREPREEDRPIVDAQQEVREELEDLAFRVINPDARASIIRRFITLQKEAGDVIERITSDMRAELDKAGIEADDFANPKGRAKNVLYPLRLQL